MDVICQSCGAPMDGNVAKERDGSDSFYCTNCFENGRFTEPHITIYEMINKTPALFDAIQKEARQSENQETAPKLKRWEIARRTAISCFSGAWDLMDKQDKTRDEIFEMIDRAHTSAYYWKKVGNVFNEARGAWQISRAYAVAGMGESALAYANYSLDICTENDIRDFDLAFAYEAISRAYKILNNEQYKIKFKELALRACEDISDEGDKGYALSEINSII